MKLSIFRIKLPSGIVQISILRDDKSAEYDAYVKAHRFGSLWQTMTWKRFQESLGREVRIYIAMDDDAIVGSALVMIDTTAFGYSTWDIPRGPLINGEHDRRADQLTAYIIDQARSERCMSLYMSPFKNVSMNKGSFECSGRHEQPEATVIIDLTQTEEDILKNMKQKGRYNIRVAAKKGVRTELSADVESFYRLIERTAKRDGFAASGIGKYRSFLDHVDSSFMMLAYPEDSDEAIAGLVGVIHGKTGIYYYGASSYEHRALMAPYALQWDTMRHCKEHGCTSYDLLGIAPPNAGDDHPWQGITSFKQKFGGKTITYPPEQMMVLRPMVKGLIDLKRRLL